MHHTFLELNNIKPLAVSRTRYIYEHPDNPDMLVKVHRAQKLSTDISCIKRKYKQLEDRFIFMSGNMRELNIYFKSRYNPKVSLINHIAPIEGIVDTDLGLGLVVSAVKDRKGKLAPTTNQLFKQGRMNRDRAAKLRVLSKEIAQAPLVIGDLNFDNIVLEQTDDGKEDFFLIDGLGEKTLIPIQTFSRRARNKYKKRFVNKIENRLQKAGF